MEETISLKDIFMTLRRRLKLLIILPIIAMIVAADSKFLRPHTDVPEQHSTSRKSNQPKSRIHLQSK